MIAPVLTDIFVVFCLAVIVLMVCNRIKVPTIVGFLLTGILAGPHCLGLVSSVEQVELVAEIGVIMLLFSIGLEFSFRELVAMKRVVFIGGAVQVLLTILVAGVISWLFDMPWNSSVFMGFLVALSSTAIVIKQLNERGEIAAPHGKITLGILIFQDLIIVPMMLLTPLLGDGGGGAAESVWIILAKIVGVLALVVALAKVIIPPLLYRVVRTQSNELFLLSIIVICFGVAWITNLAGLSLALGAFLAGMIIADSEYSHQALGNVMPFMNVFTSLFFISVGMLLNVSIMLQNIALVLIFVALILLVKILIAAFATLMLGYPLRTALLVGLALGQIGEFSFLLAQTGVEHGLIGGSLYQAFLSAAIITMMLTPFLIKLAPRFATAVYKLPLSENLSNGRMSDQEDASKVELEDHLIIVGYGVNGRNLADAADFAGVPYVILELNALTVRKERRQGMPIMYGDATNEEVLHAVGVDKAKMLVIGIHDTVAGKRITSAVRRLNPDIQIIVRTRFVAMVDELLALGASEVIPEEYETSVEIFSRVLGAYLVPLQEIEAYVDKVRAEGYGMWRSVSGGRSSLKSLDRMHLSDANLITVRLHQNAPAAGKSLLELELRNRYAVNVVAVRRDGEVLSNPGGDTTLQVGDDLIMLGSSADIHRVSRELLNRVEGTGYRV